VSYKSESVSVPHISHWALVFLSYVQLGHVQACVVFPRCINNRSLLVIWDPASSSLSSGSDRVHLVPTVVLWAVGLAFRLRLFLSSFPLSWVRSWTALSISVEEGEEGEEKLANEGEYRLGGT
jgi:hypothetical protein